MVLDERWHFIHDAINIAVLPLVIAANLLYLLLGDQHADLQFLCFFAYIVFDTLFIMLKPNCVASPGVIIAHHLLVVFGWSLMMLDSTFYRWVSYGILVEINTWFHVLRRNFRSSTVIQVMFFVSWFLLRDVMYPLVLFQFTFEYYRFSIEQDSFLNGALLILLLMALLTVLNLKWTVDLSRKFKIHNYRIVFDEKHDKGM